MEGEVRPARDDRVGPVDAARRRRVRRQRQPDRVRDRAATGKPASGVELEIRPFGIKGKTDDKGLATLPLGTRSIKGAHFLVARRGDDVAFVSDDGG